MAEPETEDRGSKSTNRERWRSVDLPEDLVADVEVLMAKKHERRPVRAPLGLFIADLIRESVSKAETQEEYAPNLELYAVEQGCAYIRDNRRDVVAELKFKDGSDLYCNIDGAKNCVHIGFAWAMPEVQRMINSGKKTEKLKPS